MALHHSAFDAREIPVIRGIFGAMSQQDANRLWQSAGFDAQAAEALAMQFSRVNYRYNERVSLDIPLRVSGASIGLGVAFRAAPDNPFRSDMSAIAPGGAAVNIGNYRFPSGLSQEAFRQSIAVRGRSLPMVYSTSISPFALIPLLSAVDNALGRVPHHHLALVRLLVVDPGTRVNAIADASPEGGRITYYQGSNIAGVDLVHEVGHLVHFDTVRRSPDLWSRWNAAIQADGRVVSTYGLQSRYEDFAEAYVLRLGGASTTRFPNRFAILDPLIQGVAAGRPPVTP